MKPLVNYRFYFRYEKYGQKHIVMNKVCKYPTKTKVYKQLMNNLNIGFIHCFGFQSEEIENNYIKV